MAVTVTAVTTPNNNLTGPANMGSFKMSVRDITFDTSYPTAGESVSATDFGLNYIAIGFPGYAVNSAGTAGFPVFVEPASDGQTATIQAYYSADTTVDSEAGNTDDLSSYTVRVTVLGH